MDKNYEISWRNPQMTVLMVTYHADVGWDDIIGANVEALDRIKVLPQEIILFHNAGPYKVKQFGFGVAHDLLYNRLPRPPKNLKFIVTLMSDPAQQKSFYGAAELLDKLFFRRKYAYVVGSLVEAERLIAQAGF